MIDTEGSTPKDTTALNGSEDITDNDAIIEISVEVDSEAAEAVSELFNRYNGGGYEEDNEAGEAGGGGAIIEATEFDEVQNPLDHPHRLFVKTYIKPGKRGQEIRQKIEEGLWYLGTIYPIPEAQIRTIRQDDWANSWKKFYKPLRIGKNVLLKPVWEEVEVKPTDLVIELEPGMAFGTGMHPTTRLCVAALEEIVKPGASLLDVGTGSGILAVLAAKLGAGPILGTDIDPVAVTTAYENIELNQLSAEQQDLVRIEQGSVPADMTGQFDVVVANILAEVIVKLFHGEFGNVPLAQPLKLGGTMILSGILDEKVPMVAEAAEKHGLHIIETKQETDWVALIAQHK